MDKGVATSDLAAEAAQQCLERRGIAATEVEVIIVATVTPDMMFPATACLVQDKIGAKGAWGFDLSAACSGFPYALQMGAKLVESGAHNEGDGDWRGRDELDHRLQGPRNLRDLRRRRGRGAAGAVRGRRDRH